MVFGNFTYLHCGEVKHCYKCSFIHKHPLNLDLFWGFLFQDGTTSTEPLDIQPGGLDFYGQRHWRQGHQSMCMCPQSQNTHVLG